MLIFIVSLLRNSYKLQSQVFGKAGKIKEALSQTDSSSAEVSRATGPRARPTPDAHHYHCHSNKLSCFGFY